VPKTGVEYATDQITVYRSCPYQCAYCYVWRNPLFTSRVTRGSYDPVREAEKYKRVRGHRVIMVSFVSDPYPPQEGLLQRTRKVLKVLAETDHTILVLTKNPKLVLRDIDIMGKGDFWLGTTVSVMWTCSIESWVPSPRFDENKVYTCIDLIARKYEPKAPSPWERLGYIALIKQKYGIKTFVSLEPIIPLYGIDDEVMNWLDIALYKVLPHKELGSDGAVDWIVLGSLNYPRIVKELGFSKEKLTRFYKEVVPKVVELLKETNTLYFIKKELHRYVPDVDRGSIPFMR